MVNSLIPRNILSQIIPFLRTDNIIVLHGARQVGKTHLLYLLQESLASSGKKTIFIDLEDSRKMDILDAGVDTFISYLKSEGFALQTLQEQNKKLFVFIDEIQYLQHPSPFLKLIADHHKYIQLIVSGSSSFNIKTKFSDSLVGRTVDFEIFNLSFSEFLRFKGITYSVSGDMDDFHIEELKKLYTEYVLYGGYPKVVLENSVVIKERYLQQIIDTYVKKDIGDIAKIKDAKKFNTLIKVLASQSGQLLNITSLAKTCSLAKQTTENYLFILENTYIIKLLTPFSSNASVEVIKAPKLFFFDTGLLQMLCFKKLQNTLDGSLFETSIFSELIKKYGTADIHFWRNKNQNEIDFIINNKEGIFPYEVKKGFQNFKRGSLSFFCGKYHTDQYYVVGLEGDKKNEHFIYPWEI